MPETVLRASHILISADPNNIRQIITSNKANAKLTEEEIQKKINEEIAAKHEKAEKLLAEVKKSPDNFAKFATENSDDTASAKQGGDLGYFTQTDMVEPFAKAAFSLKPNTVSDLVQTQFGYHIIIVKDRVKAGTEPYEKVKDSIKNYLQTQSNIKVVEQLVESLKKQASIKYVDKNYNPEIIQAQIKEQVKKEAEAQEKAKAKEAEQNKTLPPAPETKPEEAAK